jgi:hypothetical protein
MLLRLDAVHARERAARDALGLRDDSPQPDPALLAALAARPADESVAALDAAWRALGDAADLGDERYFSACARSVAASGAAPELCDWFDERVLRLWPASSDADFRALLPPGWRRELLRTHAFEELDAAFLDDARAIAASFRSGDREAEEALGGSDLLLGVTPARTLSVVTTLASERDADGLPSTAAIAAAAREALESPPLLRGVARLAARRHLEVRELGPDAVARLAAAAPLEDELLALQRALESSKR